MKNDCILLKKSEYQELLDKVRANMPDTIYINYNFGIHEFMGSSNSSISGNVELSSDLCRQTRRILENIRRETANVMLQNREAIEDYYQSKFDELSLWDRIFFNRKKLKA